LVFLIHKEINTTF